MKRIKKYIHTFSKRVKLYIFLTGWYKEIILHATKYYKKSFKIPPVCILPIIYLTYK